MALCARGSQNGDFRLGGPIELAAPCAWWSMVEGGGAAATVARCVASLTAHASAKLDPQHRTIARVARGSLGDLAIEPALEPLGLLGQGGMGEVRAATQVALGRTIAVKSARARDLADADHVALVTEARVTGAVEHPNVVPVYDVRRDEGGLPIVLMKRIEGTSWGELIRDDELVRSKFNATDVLEWHLRVFIQVASAVHYAHSRGILHRDIKPDNVMIGAFGEVYLLDWGIATRLDDTGMVADDDGGRGAGTPVYMAPEMLDDTFGAVGVSSDVYLLGATLHEVVLKRPPHVADTLDEVVRRVLFEVPATPLELPSSLADVLRQAMEKRPADRFATAEALRSAIERFLAHAATERLVALSLERLRELEGMTKKVTSGDEHDRRAIYTAFSECRFGLVTALREWPDNERASNALDHAISTMVEYELDQGDPRAAEALMVESRRQMPSLMLKIDEARERLAADMATVERAAALGRAYDNTAAPFHRRAIAMATGGLWAASMLIGARWLDSPETNGPLVVLCFSCVAFAIVLGLMLRFLRQIFGLYVARRFALGILSIPVAQIALAIVGIVEHVPNEYFYPANFFLWFVIAMSWAATLHTRLWSGALAMLVAFVVSAVWEASRWYVVSAAVVYWTFNGRRWIGVDPVGQEIASDRSLVERPDR